MKKWLLIVSVTLFLVLGLFFLLVPKWAKNYFNEHSKELTGRKASIDDLSLNPFLFSTEVAGFNMCEKNDSATFVSFKHLHLDINLWQLIGSKIQVEAIRFDSLTVNIENTGKGFNFDDFLTKDSSSAKPEKEKKPIEFEILNLSIHNGRINYFDQPVDHRLFLNNISFALPRFVYSNASANMNTVFEINDDGTLEVQSQYNPVKNAFQCHLKLRKLDLQVAKPYVMGVCKITDYKGHLHGDIDLEGQFADSSKLIVKGNTWLTDLAVYDEDPIPMIALDSAFVAVKELDVLGGKYRLRKTHLEKLAIRFDMVDSTNNFTQAFVPSSEPAAPVQDTAKSKPVYYALDSLVLQRGSIVYRDFRMESPYQYRISDMVALAENISSDSKENRLHSRGVLNEKGRYTAYVLMDPQNPLNFTVDFVVNNFQMEDVSPFSLYYAGHPLFKGELAYKGFTKVKNGNLESKNEMTIYNLKVGDKAKKSVSYALPLKFAVFLLKDKNGVVRINLPLHGNMSDPQFKIGPLVWQVVKQNLAKVVAAPEKMLASQFGMDEQKFKFIAFEDMDSLMSREGAVALDQIMLLQQKKPGLKTNLVYYNPNNTEKQALALREAKMRYSAEKMGATSHTQSVLQAKQITNHDPAFVQFLREKAASESTSVDSLALKWIPAETLLSLERALQQARNRNTKLHVATSHPELTQNFVFADTVALPGFPVQKVGYVVRWMQDE
jgi:hypothetical protein